MSAENSRPALFVIALLALCVVAAVVTLLGKDKHPPASEENSRKEALQVKRGSQLEKPLESVARTIVEGDVEDPVQPGAAPVPKPPEPPWKKNRLDELDRMYASLVRLGPESTIADPFELNMFFWLAIAPQMDARGEYEELTPLVENRIERRQDENVFTFRNRVYRVPLGVYPAFDEFIAFMENAGSATNGVPSPNSSPPAFHVDQEYLNQLGLMMHQAQTVIQERTQPY